MKVVQETLGPAALAPAKAREIEEQLRGDFGGQEVYIKKSDVNVELRAQAIRSRYNMRNRRELQAEFGISRAQFYKILRGG